MKKIIWGFVAPAFVVFSLFIGVDAARAAERTDSSVGRVGMISRAPQSANRAANMTKNLGTGSTSTLANSVNSSSSAINSTTAPDTAGSVPLPEPVAAGGTDGNCRTAYRDCMDEFCLRDESDGARCACSDNIYASKAKLSEINQIITDAQKLNTEGVARELAGTNADLIFKDNATKQSAGRSRRDFSAWLNGDAEEEQYELDADELVGNTLYTTASEYCADRLALCGADAKMEELLYSRQITNDCKSFATYLDEQKNYEQGNLLLAEQAVRDARAKMLSTTNLYNRGECLIAYRTCISDKGGCGANFENCLDASLLARRANACENILDQCDAVRDYVKADWDAESKTVLADAAKYAEQNKFATCRARTWACLEESCGASYASGNSTSAQCLNNVNVAAGICPVINECNDAVPGFRAGVVDDLKALRLRFCQNDINSCLIEKCGDNFTNPECVGKKPTEILAMCPQSMFSACRSQDKKEYNAIVSASLLKMDYNMMQGCINYFSEQLGRVCGTDMSCLPVDQMISNIKTVAGASAVDWRALAEIQVNEFFNKFEKDKTVAACQSRSNLGATVFNTARTLALYQAQDRAFRAYTARIAEISRTEDLAAAEKNCEKLFDDLKRGTNSATSRSADTAGVWVTDFQFEPALRNCKIFKVQKVCEIGGEDQATSAAKMGAGGLAAGASMGTMASPGWGTLIGGAVGLVGGIVGGAMSGGEESNCQEIPTTEDINM